MKCVITGPVVHYAKYGQGPHNVRKHNGANKCCTVQM